MHGVSVRIGDVHIGILHGAKGEFLRDFGALEENFRLSVFVDSGGKAAVEPRDFLRSAHAVLNEIAEGVFQPVGGKLRRGIVGDREEVIVADVRSGEMPLRENRLNFGGILYHFGGAAFSGFLREVVAVQKVHHMGEGRRADIVEEAGHRLFFLVCEVPDNQRDADAVFKPGISAAHVVLMKRDVFAAAVHADLPQALHGRRFRQPGDEGGNFGGINVPESVVFEISCLHYPHRIPLSLHMPVCAFPCAAAVPGIFSPYIQT